MRTETLTIVFTDIKGYTAATSQQTHQQNADMLGRIAKLIEPVVRAFTGRVIKSIGDAYMIIFRSPTEAVRCALAIQDRIAAHNSANAKEAPVHIRIAMNIGEVRVHRGDVFGDPVNIAARVESVTPADEIYFSEAIYLTMNRSDIAAERVGEYEFKGIPELVTVFRAKRATEEGVLPFGGVQLEHFRRMHWVRRAYATLWALAAIGLFGAAYLRYRPQTDYGSMVQASKTAIEQGKPIDAIALAGQIPESATQERAAVRRYRRQAVSQLLAGGDARAARTEVDTLLSEDSRDAEALMLKGLLTAKHPDEVKVSIASLAAALKLNPQLALRPEVNTAVVDAYVDPASRRQADGLVENSLKQNAVPALQHALSDPNVDRNAKNVVATRLERLGAGQDVDWVALALDDLKSTSCKTRKTAIARLVSEGDERAVGPLLKLSETKSCVTIPAKKAAETLLGK